LIGINLLREGLDIPECALVAILDADKEGFLRSKTSLVQTIGRAARNIEGRVILYADKMTDSLEYAINETDRRRLKQKEYNKVNGITPVSIKKNITDVLEDVYSSDYLAMEDDKVTSSEIKGNNFQAHIGGLNNQMKEAAGNLEFEEAARIRDEIRRLESIELGLAKPGVSPAASFKSRSKRKNVGAKPAGF
jgi:excinuclease ABC subunit B